MEASPAPSTSQNQQRQVAPPTGPQIRSRITVVCAECKRLKLKCDRRSPCGSCTKRDTVARCIYSPAAAEKVDLHSLNNRLIQVEALLASFLSQGTSPFPSTNPLMLPSLGNAISTSLIGNSSSLAHAQSLTQHVHHHHSSASALSSDSISLAPQDLASIWLDDLGAALPAHPAEGAYQGRPFSNEEHAGQIKLEPAPFDFELSRLNDGTSSNVIDVDQAPPSVYPSHDSRSSTPLRRESVSTATRLIPHILLPALSIYYPVPTISPPGTSTSSSAAFPSRPTVNSGLSSSLPTPSAHNGLGLAPATTASHQYARPQVTPALLQLLPSLSTCKQYLENAYDVAFSVRPVPFQHGWKDFQTRSIALLTDDGQLRLEREMKQERREREKEKVREARLARKVYFGGIHGLQDTDMDDSETNASGAGPSRSPRSAAAVEVVEDEYSLPFFAAMCNVLAIGAFLTPPLASFPDGAQNTPSFLHALAQQALGVWDTAQAGATHLQHEGEKLDYVLACLLGCVYILLSTAAKRGLYGDDDPNGSPGSLSASPGFENPIVALVGKLVKAARALDLGGETVSGIRRSGIALSVNIDSSGSGKQTRKEKEAEKERLKEEWKRAIWWEVMWYDLFTTDTFGHQAHIPSPMYASAQPPPCAAYPASASPPALFILPGDDDNGDDEDNEDNEDSEAPNDHEQSHHALSSSIRDTPQMTLPTSSASQNVETAVQLGDAYLGARHRLIQLVHRVKSRLAQPGCCCGYTLDQAAALEHHVRQWQSALPIQLQHSLVEDLGQGQPPNVIAGDKVLLAQTCELAVITNLLIIRIYSPFLRKQTPTSHTVQATGTEPPSGNPPALMATLHACQAITRAVSDLHSAFSSPEGRQAHDHRKSEILPCLFDVYPPEKVVFNSVVICAHAALILKGEGSALDITSLTESITAGLSLLANVPLATSHRKIVEGLSARFGASGGGGLKRKYSQVDMSITPIIDYVPQIVPEPWPTASTQQPGVHQDHVPSKTLTQQYHNPIIQLPPSSPVVTAIIATPTSTAVPRNPEVNLRGQGKQERPPPPVMAAPPSKPTTVPVKTPAEAGQKEKKAKKSAPTVGIRVRPGKQPDKGRPNTQQPLMTLAPRPLPTPEAVRLYKQKLQLHTGPSKPPPEASDPPSSTPLQDQDAHQGDATMRSRSSSVTFQPSEHRPETMNPYPTFFNQQTSTDLSNNHGAQANNFSHAQQQLKQQPVGAETPQGPFAHPSFDQPQLMEYRNPAFENTPTTNGTSSGEPMHYNSNVSSPFTNSGPPPSESSSPFTAGSASSPGHPSTPSFTTHSSLPVFGPQPDMSLNSTSYAQIQSSGPFDAHYGPIPAPYGGQHQQVHTGMSLSDVVMDQSMGISPMYGNSQQQQPHPHQMQNAPFEMKPSPIDVHSHHGMHPQHQHHQTVNEHRRGEADHDMSHQNHHASMDMTVAGPWPGPNHPQLQENPAPLQHSYQWNNNGGQYQFYH